MKRKSRARRNPLVHDPSIDNTPNIQLEVVRLVVEYDANPGSGTTDYGDFELRTTMYGNYEAFFSRGGDRRPFIWGSNTGRWFPVQMWIFLDRNNPLEFVCVAREKSETFYMLQYNENTLRVYELREVLK